MYENLRIFKVFIAFHTLNRRSQGVFSRFYMGFTKIYQQRALLEVAYPAIFFAFVLWFTVPDPRKLRREEGIELVSPKGSASSSTEAYTEAEAARNPSKQSRFRSY